MGVGGRSRLNDYGSHSDIRTRLGGVLEFSRLNIVLFGALFGQNSLSCSSLRSKIHSSLTNSQANPLASWSLHPIFNNLSFSRLNASMVNLAAFSTLFSSSPDFLRFL